ncbi:MAG TPA: cytochrome C oxidase subunit IV family protein [Polyangiaceae bacterium]|jgi:cytochrome c oxidase subunit 4
MHSLSIRHVTWTAAGLLVLWAASWAISYVELGVWSLVVALLIAAAKAVLVVLFFMEIVSERAAVQATLITGLSMVAILIFFMVADVKTRGEPVRLPPVVHAALR